MEYVARESSFGVHRLALVYLRLLLRSELDCGRWGESQILRGGDGRLTLELVLKHVHAPRRCLSPVVSEEDESLEQCSVQD